MSRSAPPGQHPYLWDTRIGSVTRWYDYGSPEDKRGTIYFDPIFETAANLSELIECTTEITHHPLRPYREPRQVLVTDPLEHERLIELFFEELLPGDAPSSKAP